MQRPPLEQRIKEAGEKKLKLHIIIDFRKFQKDISPTRSHILAKPRFAKSAKSSSHLCVTYFGLNVLLKQEPQARRRPRRLIENTILKNDESVQDANEDVGAPTS